MAHFLDLANELLGGILHHVEPRDLDSFALSNKRLYALAAERLREHRAFKRDFTRLKISQGPYEANPFTELLHNILIDPRKGDYVEQIVIDSWEWGSPNEDRESDEYSPPHRHTGPKMEAFEQAVQDSDWIPFVQKAGWIYNIGRGQANPLLLALLLPRVQYLNSIKMSFTGLMNGNLFQALKRFVKQSHSPYLSRLQLVEISGTNAFIHPLCMLTVFAALPSVTSLKAYGLVGDDSLKSTKWISLTEKSSNLRDLTLESCTVTCAEMFELIKSAKSLKSFAYSSPADPSSSPLRDPSDQVKDVLSSFTWARAALLQYASTSLEELTLHCSHFKDWQSECSFKSYTNLRVLNVDYKLLMGDKAHTTDKIVNLLPASLEVLDLFGCQVDDSAWLKELVQWIVRVKGILIPLFKELSFKETMGDFHCTVEDLGKLRAVARRAGIGLDFEPLWSDSPFADYERLRHS